MIRVGKKHLVQRSDLPFFLIPSEYSKKHPLSGSRKIAEVFQCGRIRIQLILKKKASSSNNLKPMPLLLGSVIVELNLIV